MRNQKAENNAVHGYVRRRMNGGKSAFALAADYVILRMVVFVAAYLLFASRIQNGKAVLALSFIALAIAMLLLHLIDGARYAAFYRKELRCVQQRLLRDRLLLMDQQTAIPLISNLCPEGTTPVLLQYATPIHEDHLLTVVRKFNNCGEIHVFSCSDYDAEGCAFSARMDGRLVLHMPEELLRQAVKEGLQPDEEQVIASIIGQIETGKRRRKKRRSYYPIGGSSGKYVLIALVLTGLSFVTRYALYYRLLSGLCMSVAALQALRGHKSAE